MVEIVRLNLGRKADDGETCIQQGFRDVCPEAAVGAGDEGSLCEHELPLFYKAWVGVREVLLLQNLSRLRMNLFIIDLA